MNTIGFKKMNLMIFLQIQSFKKAKNEIKQLILSINEFLENYKNSLKNT